MDGFELEGVNMTTDPTQAPVVAAYVRDAAGNYYRINSVGISQADGDARYVNVSGDTMSGPLVADGMRIGTSSGYGANYKSIETSGVAAGGGHFLFGIQAGGDRTAYLQSNEGSVVLRPNGNAAAQFEIQNALVVSGTPIQLPADPASALHAATKQYADAVVLTGSIMAYAGSTAPTGWLLAMGQAVSRTTYATLFGVCGTSYGAGNGSTTFNVPNLCRKVPVGIDWETGIPQFDTLGKSGGEVNHTLTVAELPNVTGSFGMHSGASATNISNTAGAMSAGLTNPNNYKDGGTTGSGAASYGQVNFSLGGGGQMHNNMPPYVVINYIIKT